MRKPQTKEYKAWADMKQRCTNKRHPSYKNYGGAGIKVCERWLQSKNFLEDMGKCPPGFSLERVDNSGDYTPKNCKWASWIQNCRNRRNAKAWVIGGKTYHSCHEAANAMGVSHQTIRAWCGLCEPRKKKRADCFAYDRYSSV